MKHYTTWTSTDGHRLPFSGFLVGRLADALRLKGGLDDIPGVSYKTVQRYFAGRRIEPEHVAKILEAVVDGLVPGGLVVGRGFIQEAPLRLVIHSAMRNYTAHWDRMTANVNTHMFPVTDMRDLPMPVLRLVALDLGIRVGGWAVIRFLQDQPIDWEATWLDDRSLGRHIDDRRNALGLTVSKLAELVDVSDQAVEAWRSGSSLPTSSHIESLARVLARDGGHRGEVEFTLRVLVAVEQVLADIKDTIGKDRLDDLLRAVKSTAQAVVEIQRTILSVGPSPDMPLAVAARWDDMMAMMKRQMLRGAIWELPIHGARCPIGEQTANVLSEKAKFRQEAAADFQVLAGDWSPRVTYWMSHVGSAKQVVEFMKDRMPGETGCPPERARMIAGAIMEGQLHLGNLFWEPSPDRKMAVLSPPPFGKAMNRALQAGIAASTGDMHTAIEHLRHAVRHQPQDACLHFDLGCALWQAGLPAGDMAMVDEGLLECRVAVQLDPEFGNARNEIGVILSNLRRHEEAEAAFAEAEPYHGQHNHHWYCRGNNYLALGRLEDARRAFAKAMERSANGLQVPAMARLAATLMVLGKKREARDLGRKVHHLTGEDPTENPELVLDVWGDLRSKRPGEQVR